MAVCKSKIKDTLPTDNAADTKYQNFTALQTFVSSRIPKERLVTISATADFATASRQETATLHGLWRFKSSQIQ